MATEAFKNKNSIIDAITNTFDIDQNRIFTAEELGWNLILLKRENRKYEICHFSEDSQKIIIHLVRYGFEDAGLGKITKESAEVVANDIKEKSGTNKDIYVYMESLEGLNELHGIIRKEFLIRV